MPLNFPVETIGRRNQSFNRDERPCNFKKWPNWEAETSRPGGLLSTKRGRTRRLPKVDL